MSGPSSPGPARFPATRHSLVGALGAPDPDTRRSAIEALVAGYWVPVYKYLRVARRFGHEDAEDLTQEFFTRVALKETLASFDPARGRFRTFLRVCLDRFAASARKGARRQKRGGGLQPVSLDVGGVEAALAQDLAGPGLEPEIYFRREWIRSLFEGALESLAADYRAKGKSTPLAVFLAADIEAGPDGRRPRYDELAARFEIPITQVTNHLAAARRAFRRIALERLREWCGSDEEYREEARDLLGLEVP